jgi:uncharacterized membrane protein
MLVALPSLFELLFKYRPVVFERGRLIFSAARPAFFVVAALVVLSLAVVFTYRRLGGRATPRMRVVLSMLRTAVLAIVLFALLRPALLVTTAVPERNVIGVLLDDSQSMGIKDDGITSRAVVLQRLFGDRTAPIPAKLAERFQLRFFRFSRSAQRVTDPSQLEFAGGRSDLATSLDDARRDLAALPLAGLVVVSDGADNADSSITRSLLAMSAAEVPVYTVALGAERLDLDLELARVEAPQAALRGSSILVEALVRQSGVVRDSAELVVEENGQRLASHRFALPGDGQATTVRLPVALAEEGARHLVVRVPPESGEPVTRNNERSVLVSVVDRAERVLYYEGEPRYEFAFLRRAVASDTNLHFVGLQRTADGKYFRVGVEDSLDLVGGFPTSREELFRYRALVLGSVEAAAFTAEQLRAISDFVSRRGGGLLFLGGRRAFSEGAYRDTPLEDAFPLALDAPGDPDFFRVVKVAPTPAGRGHPITELNTGSAPVGWDSMPPLTSVNNVGRLKAGATSLLEGVDTLGRGTQPVLAYHRFGRGKAVALPVQDVWRWKMNPAQPLEDRRFEGFWRQLLRWLVSEAPDRVTMVVLGDQVAEGESLTLIAEVRDEAFRGLSNAAVRAVVTTPSGRVDELSMDWVVGSEGQYRVTFPAAEVGQYEMAARVQSEADTLTSESAFAAVGDVGREYFGAEARPALLRRIASETGGRSYTAETVSDLPQDIVYTERGITRTERLDVWDMPIIFILLAGLLAAEWGLRRSRGLA